MARKVSTADFVAFLRERLAAKDGYIFGATGQDPKRLSDWYFYGQYGGAQLRKALYWREHARRVWDCNGLAEGYYKDVTGRSIDARARDNYASWCQTRGEGKIPARCRVPGAAVFKRSSYIHHVGFLVEPVDAKRAEGDWYVIEAKGVMYGVVRSRLNGNDWNCWGLMTKYFDYGDAATAPAAPGTGARTLRRGDRGEDVRTLQEQLLSLGFDLPRYGADGDFGAETEAAVRALQAELGLEVDGVYGKKTREALERELAGAPSGDAGDEPGATRLRVTAERAANVRSGPGLANPILGVARAGEEFDSLAVADNGWRRIPWKDGAGWISPRMCEVIGNG